MNRTGTITIRHAEERGQAEQGWLHSRFTFSFADYFDPEHMWFHALRVINDDIIEPGKGFGMHPHHDMEIISYVVDGALEHKDSMGNGSVVRSGDVQYMSAGTGITHSEFNPLPDQAMHLLQIWIRPDTSGLKPSYEQIHLDPDQKRNRLTPIASPDGRDGSIEIHQDAVILAGVIEPTEDVHYDTSSDRALWLQVVEGDLTLNGTQLHTGDGAAIEQTGHIDLHATAKTEVLLFDVA